MKAENVSTLKPIFISFLFCLVVSNSKLYAQNSCPNIDFSQGNFNHWVCRTATMLYSGTNNYNTLVWTGTLPIFYRHTIMTDVNGYDSHTCNENGDPQLKQIPDGFKYSAKIGNDNVYVIETAIKYQMTVDSATAMLILHYSFLYQDNSHLNNVEPYFLIRIEDTLGNPFKQFKASHLSGTPGFQQSGFNTYWKDWSEISIPLANYIGKTINIVVATSSCAYGGHFGYGYFVGEYQPMNIDLFYCNDNNYARMEAPIGFVGYIWKDSTGQVVGNSKKLTVSNPIEGSSYSLTMINSLGDTTQLSCTIKKTALQASFICDTLTNRCHPTTIRLLETTPSNAGNIIYRDWKIEKLYNPIQLEFFSTDTAFEYTFKDTGYYKISYTVYSNKGCGDTAYMIVHSFPKTTNSFIPDFNYTLQPSLCTQSLSCTNISYSKNPILFSEWKIKNERTGETLLITRDSILQYNFYDTGLYRIILGIYTYECGDTVSRLIHIDSISNTKDLIDTSFCSYVWKDSIYTTSGTYQRNYYGNKCDSIILLHLTIIDTLSSDNQTIDGDTLINQTGTFTYRISPVKGATAYHWLVNVRFPNGETQNLCNLISPSTSINIKFTQSNITTIKVEALNSCDTVFVAQSNIQSTVGMTSFIPQEDITLYPNPTTDQLFIKSEALIIQEIKLYSVLGKELFTKRIESSETTLQTGNLASGLYFVHIKTDKGIIVRKISKE